MAERLEKLMKDFNWKSVHEGSISLANKLENSTKIEEKMRDLCIGNIIARNKVLLGKWL